MKRFGGEGEERCVAGLKGRFRVCEVIVCKPPDVHSVQEISPTCFGGEPLGSDYQKGGA